MKLNKSFVQISTTALLTAVGVIIIMKNLQNPAPPFHGAAQARIPWDAAQNMMKDYKDYNPTIMKTIYPEVGDNVVDTLEGFIFKKSQLMEILTNNHSGTNADSIIFMFGIEGTFNDNAAGVIWPNMHIIAIGMHNGTLITSAQHPYLPSIFDKADPCPPNCPR